MSAFNERKTAQIAAYFLIKRGGKISLLKLLKLLYLVERESLKRYDMFMIGDRIVSMPHGPVLSRTYDLMTGCMPSVDNGWESYISTVSNHELSLRNPLTVADLGELSRSDLQICDDLWKQFGTWDRWRLRDYTHSEHCPEWKNPHGSSVPLGYSDILRAIGRSDEEITVICEEIDEKHKIEKVFSLL